MISKEKLRKFLMKKSKGALEKYAKRMPIRADIAKGILANTEDFSFEFLEDGTRIQIVEG